MLLRQGGASFTLNQPGGCNSRRGDFVLALRCTDNWFCSVARRDVRSRRRASAAPPGLTWTGQYGSANTGTFDPVIAMDPAIDILAGLTAPILAYALVVVFIAALVRGYSGFGSSALMVTSLTLVLPPAEVVPILLLLEIVASLSLLAPVWKDIPWRTLVWLLIGAALAMPVGFALLAALPASIMRAIVSALVLAASLAIWFGVRFRTAPRAGHIFGAGLASGLANGTAGVGGLPVVLFSLSTVTQVAAARALVIVFLMLGDIYGTAVAAGNGLLNMQVAERAAVVCPSLFLGVWLGNRHFIKTSPDSFRRFTLLLLMFLSGLGLLRAVLL